MNKHIIENGLWSN